MKDYFRSQASYEDVCLIYVSWQGEGLREIYKINERLKNRANEIWKYVNSYRSDVCFHLCSPGKLSNVLSWCWSVWMRMRVLLKPTMEQSLIAHYIFAFKHSRKPIECTSFIFEWSELSQNNEDCSGFWRQRWKANPSRMWGISWKVVVPILVDSVARNTTETTGITWVRLRLCTNN